MDGVGAVCTVSEVFCRVCSHLGIENKEKGTGADHHNPKFDIDEDVLKSVSHPPFNMLFIFLILKGNIIRAGRDRRENFAKDADSLWNGHNNRNMTNVIYSPDKSSSDF